MTKSDETAVKDLLVQLVAAWDANDADAFADLHTDDATVVTAGSFAEGKETLRQYMKFGFAGPLQGTTSSEEPQHIRFVGKDVAIVNSLGGFIPAGETVIPESFQRRATWVFSRADGKWLVESYHNCTV